MNQKRKWYFFYCFTILILLFCIMSASQVITVISENITPERSRCIIIDPGHGGEDGGAISLSGQPESKYNLEIALRLKDMMHLLGHDTRLTRCDDVSIYTKGETLSQKKASDLKERVRIINETTGALLISIHQNHFSDTKYFGAQVFYADDGKSKALAKHIQTALVSSLNPESNRKAQKISGVYLMEHINCPGILIECGFLSNVPEEAQLRNPEYQKKLAGTIAASVSQHLSNT